MQSRQGIDLGKAACIAESGEPIPFRFTGWLDQKTLKRVQGPDLASAMAQFCSEHEGEDLRILPESMFDEMFDEAAGWRLKDSILEDSAAGACNPGSSKEK